MDAFEPFLVPSNDQFKFLSKPKMKEITNPIEVKTEDKESIISIVHIIGNLISSCFYP